MGRRKSFRSYRGGHQGRLDRPSATLVVRGQDGDGVRTRVPLEEDLPPHLCLLLPAVLTFQVPWCPPSPHSSSCLCYRSLVRVPWG